jgi:deltex-like protein
MTLISQSILPLAILQQRNKMTTPAVLITFDLAVDHAVVENERLLYNAPISLSETEAVKRALVVVDLTASASSATNSATKPSMASSDDDDDEDCCAICLEELVPTTPSSSSAPPDQIQRIVNCHHTFHAACVLECLNREPKCPICRKPVGDSPIGSGPSGTMTISTVSRPCPGDASTTTIQMVYDIPSGVQSTYHINPGHPYDSTSRTAYLPNNVQGRALLTRLKYAWMHGLTFGIGTSLTTGQSNVVIWSSIHHKTSISGHAHGFPDPQYMDRCNADLDALHVPNADGCFQSLQAGTSTTGATYIPKDDLVRQTIYFQANGAATYGSCPSGGMTCETHIVDRQVGTKMIQIRYEIPDGTQQSNHPQPGRRYPGTTRVAYLPETEQGRNMLQRFQWAFQKGRSFTIGTSLTTGQTGVVVWSKHLPHKTNWRGGGPFGFPDANYVATANDALDTLKIPRV